MLPQLCLIFLGLTSPINVFHDITYSSPDGRPLRLDLYVPPATIRPAPAILWIHGGGWYAGSKSDCPLQPLANEGYVVASIDYRLSGRAPFPAQIDDCRSALRWLRSNAATYHLDPNRIAAAGYSAGGHLAALLGTMGDKDTRVQAVVDGFGPTDFIRMEQELTATGVDTGSTSSPYWAIAQLLGGPFAEKQELARQASPMTYVSSSCPPFLILQAEHDQTVPAQQSIDFAAALTKAGVPTELVMAPTGGHGPNPLYPDKIRAFLAKYLRDLP